MARGLWRVGGVALAIAALGGCAAADDGADSSTTDEALDSRASRTKPPDVDPPRPNGVSFARDTSERILGVHIQDKGRTHPKVVYSVRLPDLDPSESLRVRGEVTLSRCNRKDIAGESGDSATTPCDRHDLKQSPYAYTPHIHAVFILADSPIDATGDTIGGWAEMGCAENVHHCAVALPEASLRKVPRAKAKFINLIVTADANGSNARSFDVMEVEQGHGALDVTRMGPGADDRALHDSSDDLKARGDMGIDQTADEGDTKLLRLMYQVRVDGLRGNDIIDTDAHLHAVLGGGFSCDPLIVGDVIVTEDRDARVPKKKHDARLTVKNGHNCADHSKEGCSYRESGAVQLDKDAPSTMYVSYVVSAARSCAAPGGGDKWHVEGKDGFLRINVRR